MRNSNKLTPIILTIIMLVIIIYLVTSVKQPYVECSKSNTNNIGIKIDEDVVVELDGGKISKMTLVKTITLPDKYLKDDANLNAFKFALEKSYEYLKDAEVKVTTSTKSVIARVVVKDNETLILNNIEKNLKIPKIIHQVMKMKIKK